MRKLILNIATSLDGYIAGPRGEIDWCLTDQDYGMNEFLVGVDTIVMGRKTWQMIHESGDWSYGDRKIFVISHRHLNAAADPVTFVSEPPGEFLAGLKRQWGRAIWLMGGGQLIHAVARKVLIDEYIISIHPVLLGGGTPCFPPGFNRQRLRLKESRQYDSGLVQVHYVQAG